MAPSPWPLNSSISLGIVFSSLALWMHGFLYANYLSFLSVLLLTFTMAFWFRDIISEATYLGTHTLKVQSNLILGVGLFILSEALFFFSIFWTYFHSSLSPNIELGGQWPPLGIETINTFELPLLNTILLLSSGITVTYAHHCLIQGKRKGCLNGIGLTIFLAILFTAFQATEYLVSSFTISDGVYGSCFYFSTGFHGIHVLIGTAFIAVMFWRAFAYHLTQHHHLGFTASILYWHFVDYVWLALFLIFYYWVG